MKRNSEAVDGQEQINSRSRSQAGQKRIRYAEERKKSNGSANRTVKTLADEKEVDPHRLAQRQKQIDYGKNTIGYDRYCAQVPRHQRRPGKHPMTPDKTKRVGKKVFDGMVRKWRQALHKYDPPELVEATKTLVVDVAISSTVEATTRALNADESVQSEATTCSRASLSAPTDSNVEGETQTKSVSTPPSRSIYENFDEDNFDEDDTDDDLL